jgi:hypothetical protein
MSNALHGIGQRIARQRLKVRGKRFQNGNTDSSPKIADNRMLKRSGTRRNYPQ